MINKFRVFDLLRMSLPGSLFMILANGNCVVSFMPASGGALAREAEPVSAPVGSQLFESRMPTKNKKKTKAQLQWESMKFPIIYWKAHPVTVVPGATGQLITTFDAKEDVMRRGTLKYTLRLSELPSSMTGVAIQLIDANGFKLTEFDVPRDQFHPVPGSSLIEAAGDSYCTKIEYRQARDYVIKQPSQD